MTISDQRKNAPVTLDVANRAAEVTARQRVLALRGSVRVADTWQKLRALDTLPRPT